MGGCGLSSSFGPGFRVSRSGRELKEDVARASGIQESERRERRDIKGEQRPESVGRPGRKVLGRDNLEQEAGNVASFHVDPSVGSVLGTVGRSAKRECDNSEQRGRVDANAQELADGFDRGKDVQGGSFSLSATSLSP